VVDRQAVGYRGPEFEFALEKGKVREMARQDGDVALDGWATFVVA
jgi:hypothetical protein